MKREGPVILLCLTLIGMILAYLSERMLPLGYGVALLWLGVVVTANGSIWFGGWGVAASALFPFLAALLQGGTAEDSALAILPNLLNGLVPAVVFRRLHADSALHDRRSMIAYILWAVAVPWVLSGTLAAGSWVLLGKVDWSTFRLLALDWSLSNIVVLIVLGIPAAYVLTPVFRERGWLVAGWWR